MAFFLIGRAVELPFRESPLFGIGIIVANVPEGLLPTVTPALAMGSQRTARRNALIRHLPSAETLGSTTVICTDKTGTLTQNRMNAKRLFLGGHLYGLAEVGHALELRRQFQPFFEGMAYCASAPGWGWPSGRARLVAHRDHRHAARSFLGKTRLLCAAISRRSQVRRALGFGLATGGRSWSTEVRGGDRDPVRSQSGRRE